MANKTADETADVFERRIRQAAARKLQTCIRLDRDNSWGHREWPAVRPAEVMDRHVDPTSALVATVEEAERGEVTPELHFPRDLESLADELYESGALPDGSERFKTFESSWHQGQGSHHAVVGDQWATVGFLAASRSAGATGLDVAYKIEVDALHVLPDFAEAGYPEALLATLMRQMSNDVDALAEGLDRKGLDEARVSLHLGFAPGAVSPEGFEDKMRDRLGSHWNEEIARLDPHIAARFCEAGPSPSPSPAP